MKYPVIPEGVTSKNDGDELLEAYCPICQMVVIPDDAVLMYLLNKSDLKIDDVKNEMRKAKGK